MNQELLRELREFLTQLTFFNEPAHIEQIRERAKELSRQMPANLTSTAPDAPSLRCPYCGSPLGNDDTARDGEALWCADCDMRVEYWDALSEAEEARA